MSPTEQARPLAAHVDSRGEVSGASAALAGFVGLRDARDVVGRRLDDLASGTSLRALVRAAADARSTGTEIGPVDLWLESPSGPAVGRFWVFAGDDGGVELAGHDLGDLPDAERATALEAVLLDRVASGDPVFTVLRGAAQLLEWQWPGARCTIGSIDDDGVIRHRFAPTLRPEILAALDAMSPTHPWADAARGADGVVVYDDVAAALPEAADVVAEDGLSRCLTVRIDHEDQLVGLLAVFLPDDAQPDANLYRQCRKAAETAALAMARAREERRVRHAALHDALTGLPNRRLLVDRIAQALDRNRRGDRRTAVLMVDLDEFKVANDTISHDAGDEILLQVAALLRRGLGEHEVVGRFGGDEFLLLTDVADLDEARARAERIRSTLDTSVVVRGEGVRVAASVGVAVADAEADADLLVRDADAALHQAKRDGRNRVRVHDRLLRQQMLERVATEDALRQSLARRELEVHYQPVVDLRTFRVVGAESLVRWRRSGDVFIPPGSFVPIAEGAGLIEDLGIEVLDQAVAVGAQLRDAGWSDLVMAVNVSPVQLTDSLVDIVRDALSMVGLPPEGLCLEITESALAHDGADGPVRALAALGVAIAIDDFGTGYSSLNQLRRFAGADALKIDASFVADLEGPDPSGQAIVAATLALGHGMGMSVTAEGVETIGQLQLLRELGCDHAQGFLLSPPVAASELPAVLGQVVPDASSG